MPERNRIAATFFAAALFSEIERSHHPQGDVLAMA
jgi:hypothetical protein